MGFLTTGDWLAKYGTVAVNRVRPLKSEQLPAAVIDSHSSPKYTPDSQTGGKPKMSKLMIKNISQIVSGDIYQGILDGDTIIVDAGKISFIGWLRDADDTAVDATVDARGTTVIPGLIDSHVHVVLGDYTPRQKTVDFIDSYLHGGITSMISAGEIHAPGRPTDVAGV